MSTPMTTEQAIKRHHCTQCEQSNDLLFQGCTCVESATCSVRCTACGERIWFTGSINLDTPDEFNCPYCGTKQLNEFKKR